MKEIKLNDKVVLPLMAQFGIDRKEAELRLQLLAKSGIMQTGDPDDPETQRLIDGFLAQSSNVLAETVLFEGVFSTCMEDKKLVENYDRLSGNKMARTIKAMKQGIEPRDSKKQFKKFEAFIRSTVFAQMLQSCDNNPLSILA